MKSGMLRRSKALKRTAMKPPRPAPKGVVDREIESVLAAGFKRRVCSGQPCIMCTAEPPTARMVEAFGPDLRHREAHHVVGKRHLKRAGLVLRLWDSDNGVTLCRYHHDRHERAVERVPRSLLPAKAVAFAESVGMLAVIEREYRDA